MVFRKLKRVRTHGYANHIPNFDKVFPELKHLYGEELGERFNKLGLDFYTENRTPVKLLVRITLPFGILVWIIMFLSLPIKFMIDGT